MKAMKYPQDVNMQQRKLNDDNVSHKWWKHGKCDTGDAPHMQAESASGLTQVMK